MMQNSSFQRKVAYLAVIALLLIPLYTIGHPSTGEPNAPDATPGGTLAQLRNQHDLAMADLGEIDPSGEAMKLATLGMRGIAACVLWMKSHQYKKYEDWEKMVATLNQITKLQPNFRSVWEFQSHNLSYNTSVEYDDYRFRYQWVKRGIEFQMKGTRYNKRVPKMFHTVGWYVGQKVGRADEHRQFRRLYREDGDFHQEMLKVDIPMEQASGIGELPDNWLTSRLWYGKAYSIIDDEGVPLRGPSPHIFFSDGPKCWMNYATAIESEGHFGLEASSAWRQGGASWREFGERTILTSVGIKIRMNGREALESDLVRLNKEIDDLLPGLREDIYNERLAALTDAQRNALLADPAALTTPREWQARQDAEVATFVRPIDLANRAPAAAQTRAKRLAALIGKTEEDRLWTENYRTQISFDYWRTRCDIEQIAAAVKAREFVYQAKQAMSRAEVDEARSKFEAAWAEWSTILKDNPVLVSQLMADDLAEDIEDYMKLLGQFDEKLPDNFGLQSIVEQFGLETKLQEEEERRKAASQPQPETPKAGQAQPETPNAAPSQLQ